MADERCPLCMEKLKNGECGSCGYKLPDEENISSIYDYEPSEYPEPEPVIREITPEIQMEEIYPNRDNALKFKVRDDEGKTVRADAVDDLNKTKEKPVQETFKSNSNTGTNANPYSGFTPDGVPHKVKGIYIPNSSTNSTEDTETAQGFVKKYWWLLLLSFFIPILGIILNSTMKSELKMYKASYLVIVAIVLGFIIPP